MKTVNMIALQNYTSAREAEWYKEEYFAHEGLLLWGGDAEMEMNGFSEHGRDVCIVQALV